MVLGLILFSISLMAQTALIKSYECKKGFTGNYWVPIEIRYDNAAGTTGVVMGLYKDASLYNEVKDSTSLRQENILARKGDIYLIGHIEESALMAAIKAYTGPAYNGRPRIIGENNSYINYFSDATTQ